MPTASGAHLRSRRNAAPARRHTRRSGRASLWVDTHGDTHGSTSSPKASLPTPGPARGQPFVQRDPQPRHLIDKTPSHGGTGEYDVIREGHLKWTGHSISSKIDTMNNPTLKHKDPSLAAKAKLLLESQYFLGDELSQQDKQLIFYVLAGIKPVSEVVSQHMEQVTPTRSEARPDDQAKVAKFLETLGLRYAFQEPYDGMVIVSLQDVLPSELQAAYASKDEAAMYQKVGELFGYPKTAVDACVAEWAHGQPSLLSIEDQERIEESANLLPGTVFFRFSRAHWRAELATVRQWHAVLMDYGMAE